MRLKRKVHIAVIVRDPGEAFEATLPVDLEFDSALPAEDVCRALKDAVKLAAEGLLEELDERATTAIAHAQGEA